MSIRIKYGIKQLINVIVINFVIHGFAQQQELQHSGYFYHQEHRGNFKNKEYFANVKNSFPAIVGFISYLINRKKFSNPGEYWNVNHFKRYFKKKYGDYENVVASRWEILRHHELYDYDGFRNFILTLPELKNYLEQFRKSELDNLLSAMANRNFNEQRNPALQPVHRFLEYFDSIHPKPESIYQINASSSQHNIKKEKTPFQRLEELRVTQLNAPIHYAPEFFKNEYEIAFKQFIYKQSRWQHKVYQLSNTACQLLVDNNCIPSEYKMCRGIELQQMMHAEYIYLIEQASIHQKKWDKENTKGLLSFIDCGHTHNQAGSVITSNKILNVCWALYDCLMAVSEGIADGTLAVTNNFIHPIQTIQNIGVGVAMLGHGIAQLTDLAIDLAVLRYTNPLAFDHKIHQISKMIDTIAFELYKQIKENPHDVIRKTSSFVTEAMLTGKLVGSLGNFFDLVKTQLPKYAQLVENGMPPLAGTALNGQTFAAAAAVEATEILSKIEPVVDGLNKTTSVIKFGGPFIPLEKELKEIEKIYKDAVKGFGECADQFVEWENGLKHIFEIGIKDKNGKLKIDGFHHDLENFLEKTGVIKLINKKEYPGGFYEAEVLYNGITQRKTFFPADWSRENVTKTIVDFYEKNKQLAIPDNGAWKIEQQLIEQVKLRIIISNDMKNITSYPIFEMK